MKKNTLLTTATLLSIACIGSQPLNVQAASAHSLPTSGYRNILVLSGKNTETPIYNGGSCNINKLLEQILQKLPGCDIPGIGLPEAPDTNLPETDFPENTPPESEAPDINIPEEDESLSYAEQVAALVNIERAKEGLSPLTIDQKVQAAAQVRAVECEQRFSHTRPNGSSFSTALTEQGIAYRRAGENIAWGQRSPREVVNAWMNSDGHRANIMNKSFTKIGVGYYQNANGVKYWSQLFTD